MRIFLNFVLLITILTLLHAEEDISRKKKKKKQEVSLAPAISLKDCSGNPKN